MITVRKAQLGDFNEILKKIQELADFEEMPHGPKLTVDDLQRDSQLSLFHSFVALYEENTENGHHHEPLTRPKIVGYTIGYFTYTLTVGKTFFLEDIYVQPAYRCHGVGLKLFKENIKFALDSRCKQMLWHVLEWNSLARSFYHKLDAENLSSGENGLEFFRLNREIIGLEDS